MSGKHGSTVQVNGKTYHIPNGRSISVVNSTIYVDGKVWSADDTQNKTLTQDLAIASKIELHIHPDAKGNTPDVSSEMNQVIVHGNVRNATASSGNIQIDGYATGNVTSSSGDITIGGDVHGSSSSSSGDIKIGGDVHGSAETSSGDIRAQKIRNEKKMK